MNRKFELNKDIILRKTDGIYMLYNSENVTMYEFNESGGMIIELIENGLSSEEMINKISKEFMEDKELISSDVNQLLDRLLDLAVIKEINLSETQLRVSDKLK